MENGNSASSVLSVRVLPGVRLVTSPSVIEVDFAFEEGIFCRTWRRMPSSHWLAEIDGDLWVTPVLSVQLIIKFPVNGALDATPPGCEGPLITTLDVLGAMI